MSTTLEDPIFYTCTKCRREFTPAQTELIDGVRKHAVRQRDQDGNWITVGHHTVFVREDH